MKKKLFVLVIGFIFYHQAEAKKMPGYYVTKSGDTIKVVFEIPKHFFAVELKYEILQSGMGYYISEDKLEFLAPTQAREISFDYSGERIRMLSSGDNPGMFEGALIIEQPTFLRLIKDGTLKLLMYYYKKEETVTYYSSAPGGGLGSRQAIVKHEDYIFQKDTAAFFQTKNKSSIFEKDPFQKDMLSYLGDCPQIAKKITLHRYTRLDIESMVDEYNNFCGRPKQAETK